MKYGPLIKTICLVIILIITGGSTPDLLNRFDDILLDRIRNLEVSFYVYSYEYTG